MATKTNTPYLTKSLFVKALECPTKLYYLGKKDEYAVVEEDAFQEALQEVDFRLVNLPDAITPAGN